MSAAARAGAEAAPRRGAPEGAVRMGGDATGIRIAEGLSNMDFARVTALLAGAKWSPGISRAEVEQGARHSALVVGAFDGGRQVGYARAISDRTRFGYLSDVYVDEAYRGRGIARAMVDRIVGHERLRDVYQWALRTTDAQAVYEKCGFRPVSNPECWMEIRRERPAR